MKLISLFFLLALSNAFAGNEVGNGGDFIKCSTGLELLDFFEGKQFKEYSYLAVEGKGYEDILKDKLQILKSLDKKLFKIYSKYKEQNVSKIVFLKNANLTDVKDSHHLMIPKDCVIKQAAIQKDKMENKKTQYFIDHELWQKADEFTKAGLISHEIIYEHFRSVGEVNSKKVRLFNSLLFSEKIKTLSQNDYNTFKKSLRIPLY